MKGAAMPKKLKDLSKTEWLLMQICWKLGKVPARYVYDEVLKQKDWQYQTAKTILDRLVKHKGYLRRERLASIWLYEPVVSRTQAVNNAIKEFSDLVLDNEFEPILKHFQKRRRISMASYQKILKLVKE